MSSLTIYLAKLLGLYSVLVALVMIVHKDAMIAGIEALFHDTPALILAGIMGLGVGLAIVLGHNVWRGSALAVVVTIVGWLSLLKGLALLSLAPGAGVAYLAALHYTEYFYVYSAVTLLLGIYLTLAGFMSQNGHADIRRSYRK